MPDRRGLQLVVERLDKLRWTGMALVIVVESLVLPVAGRARRARQCKRFGFEWLAHAAVPTTLS